MNAERETYYLFHEADGWRLHFTPTPSGPSGTHPPDGVNEFNELDEFTTVSLHYLYGGNVPLKSGGRLSIDLPYEISKEWGFENSSPQRRLDLFIGKGPSRKFSTGFCRTLWNLLLSRGWQRLHVGS